MAPDRKVLLYIAGWGRCGSTILEKALGQVPGFFVGGELRYLWERNLLEGFRCGCGRDFRNCPVWSDVFHRAFGGMDIDAENHARQLDRICSERSLLHLATKSGRHRLNLRALSLRESINKLYACMFQVTQADVIVDSTKVPAYGRLLREIPDVDVRTLHLVRDPRAVAYSWRRRKAKESGEAMRTRFPADSAWRWVIRNAEAEIIMGHRTEYMRMRYEDFVSAPKKWIYKIAAFAGISQPDLHRIHEDGFESSPVHTSSGNPDVKFATGQIRLTVDDQWREGMSRLNRIAVSSIALPVLRRYGYSIRAAGS